MAQLKSRRGASDSWIVTSPVKPGSSFLTIRVVIGSIVGATVWQDFVRRKREAAVLDAERDNPTYAGAYRQGLLAQERGLTLAECPFPIEQPVNNEAVRSAWLKGFTDSICLEHQRGRG